MSVTVLTPNGRRQNVKITPNTTLLQVLEEVCSKHGFKPEEYDIRHHNKILDVSSIFRFSGLPNNAFLEMTEATKQRSESPVVLCLQFESGERLTGEFTPSDNLWHIIMTLNPEAKSFDNPVIIYMRTEVWGKENLEKTTLRSLGLTSGRAILRFFNRTPEELRSQANVSVVLSRSTTSKEEKNEQPPANIKAKDTKAPDHTRRPSSDRNEAIKRVEEKKEQPRGSVIHDGEEKSEDKSGESPKPVRSPTLKEKDIHSHNVKNSEPTKDNTDQKVVPPHMNSNKDSPPKSSVKPAVEEEEEEGVSKVILLGDRNAVAYSLNKVKPTVFEELPDDFYDLTVADAKLLLRDAKQLCADLENAPLMTSAQRELEKNKKILSLLNQYKKTVLRIKFPDRTVLQGTFSSVEKVSAVEKFVADYLQNPKISFYLYTTPPKQILKSDSNLLECNCVPCAILYFGVSDGTTGSKQFLRSDVMDKFSSPSAAALTAYESRGMLPKKINEEKEPDRKEDEIVVANEVKTESNASAGPSTSTTSTPGRQSGEQESSPPFKVPKWFKIKK